MTSMVSADNQYLPAYDTQESDLEILKWTNIARTDPHQLVPMLENMLPYFHGTLYSAPGKEPTRTVEGAAGVRGTIAFLQAQRPIAALKWDQYLAHSSEEMAVAQGKTT